MINSNLGPISYRNRNMASFRLKNAHLSYPLYSTQNLKMFPLNCIPQILYTKTVAYLRGRGYGAMPPFGPTMKILYRPLYMKSWVFCHFPARIAKFNNVWWSFFQTDTICD